MCRRAAGGGTATPLADALPYWGRYFALVVTSSLPGVPGNPRQTSLIASLRERFRLAEQNRDAKAKQALFREAIYLGIQPQVFTEMH